MKSSAIILGGTALLLLFISVPGHAQYPTPGPTATGPATDQGATEASDGGWKVEWEVARGCGVAVDGTGAAAVCGELQGTADLDPGPGTCSVSCDGQPVIFLSRFDPSGKFLWAKTWPGSLPCVAVDGIGNILMACSYQPTVEVQESVPETEETPPETGLDGFLCKLDPYGHVLWEQTCGGPSDDKCTGVGVDGVGNIYVVGSFEETADFDPGEGVTETTSVGYKDCFLAKLDSNGNLLAVETWGEAGNDEVAAIAVDALGNVSLACWTAQPPADSEDKDSFRGSNILWCKYDSSGVFQRIGCWGGNYEDMPTGITADRYGSVYLVGGFTGTVDFNPADDAEDPHTADYIDCFLSKFNPMGQYQWTQTWHASACGVTIDNTGDIYVAGSFGGDVDFDPGPGEVIMQGGGGFVSKFDQNGKLLWARQWDHACSGVTIDGAGNIFITGGSGGTAFLEMIPAAAI